MTLRLTLENVDKLPDGGPVSVSVNGRGLDIGRHQHLDWTLPDSSRYVSGKHCEIRFRDGGYWLHDVSRNGTFLNGSDARLTEPYRLRSGDRMMIGPYIVAVEVAGVSAGGGGVRPAAAASAGYAQGYDDDPWAPEGDVAAPEDRAAYKPVGPAARLPDFLDTVAPPVSFDAGRRVLATGDDVWGPPPPAPPPPDIAPEPLPIAAPIPRRPVATAFDEPAPLAAAPSPDLLEKIAVAAGLSPSAFSGRDPAAVAGEIGAVLRLTADRLSTALHARDETRTLIRSASRSVARGGANPLAFAGDAGEALTLMFSDRSPRRLDAAAAVERSFADLESHQMLLLGAIRETLERLFEDLAPDKIDSSVPAERGLVPLVAPRKARLWDIFVERWRAVSRRSDGRLTEAFMALIGEAYDKLDGIAR